MSNSFLDRDRNAVPPVRPPEKRLWRFDFRPLYAAAGVFAVWLVIFPVFAYLTKDAEPPPSPMTKGDLIRRELDRRRREAREFDRAVLEGQKALRPVKTEEDELERIFDAAGIPRTAAQPEGD